MCQFKPLLRVLWQIPRVHLLIKRVIRHPSDCKLSRVFVHWSYRRCVTTICSSLKSNSRLYLYCGKFRTSIQESVFVASLLGLGRRAREFTCVKETKLNYVGRRYMCMRPCALGCILGHWENAKLIFQTFRVFVEQHLTIHFPNAKLSVLDVSPIRFDEIV